MSHYKEYTKEIHGRHVLENEYGFVVYEITDDKCYIADIYVAHGHRRSGRAHQFAREVEVIARERCCRYLLGSVIPTTIGATESMKIILSYGMKLKSSHENFIWFEKRLFE